jgi:hypothetical protein
MTEVHQLNVSAGSRHIRIADAKDTRKRMDREESVIHVTHEVQDELYRLPADRGAEQRRVQTYKRRTRVFFMVGFMTSCTTLWPSP